MSDNAPPTQAFAVSHRQRRSLRTDALTVHHRRRAVILPLLLLAALLGVAFSLWSMAVVALGWLLIGLLGGVAGVAVVAGRGVWRAAVAAEAAAEARRAAVLTALTGAAAAVEKSVAWSADELCRGARPPLPDTAPPQAAGPNAEVDTVLSALQVQAVASLIRVHDESQSVVLLEVLRRLAMREHALVSKALTALSQLEMLTDDPELLSKTFEIDHLVTRLRRQVESTAVLGGQSLRSVRQPVSVTTTLRGAVSEVVQYPRVVVAAGSVGAELGLPGHVGPDLTHLLAELIENGCEYSDPATKVTVRTQRVPNGLAVEVEDRAIPMHPQTRAQMNHLLKAPGEVDVSGQLRSGQVGLLVAAKIARSHGLSVVLQENVTGGTTALVVIPARLLVAIDPLDGADSSHQEIRPAAPSPSAADASAGRASRLIAAEAPLAGEAPAPELPRRTRQPGAHRPPPERGQAPTTAARPGLAGAFRHGIESGRSTSSPPDPTGQPRR
ncbi:sensor histidine kinase [Streptomyces californicus]|uniref:sensor histidine kinase n=1 Tax=Streptomyces californicus TaxID=67351 RepID=UPI00379E39D4